MRERLRRHLGKLLAATAIAVTGTAMMMAVTLPGDASGSPGAAGEGQNGRQDQAAEQRPGTVEPAPEEGKKGSGRDPLTEQEMERAERLALGRESGDDSQDVQGDKGPEPLTTDLAEPEPAEVSQAGAPRRALVSYYDYQDDTYITKTVDLGSGKVEDTETQRGVQPPPTRAEAREAAEVLLRSPLGGGLKADYKDAMGKALTSAEQLKVTAYVYRVDEENAGPAGLRECGAHRCVRLFTRAAGGPWIDTRQFVIDLSERSVGRLS